MHHVAPAASVETAEASMSTEVACGRGEPAAARSVRYDRLGSVILLQRYPVSTGLKADQVRPSSRGMNWSNPDMAAKTTQWTGAGRSVVLNKCQTAARAATSNVWYSP